MNTRTLLVAVVFFCVSDSPFAQETHSHLLGAEKLGSVHFPVSCTAGVQDSFERGVALLHSFWYEEAQKTFEAVAQEDPRCEMAYWGIAMSQWRQLLGPPDPSSSKFAEQALDKAEKLNAGSARERDFIAALHPYFRDADTGEPLARAVTYSQAMSRVYEKYPEDTEAGAFYALSLLASEQDNDTTFANRKKAGQILEKLFDASPDHPGLAHYLIHTYDKPQLAQFGLTAAQRFAQIAPDSPHAIHMPSHIFARLGMWQADIDSNLASVAATQKVLAMHMEGAAHQFHAMVFLLYAYLQSGRENEALQIIEKVNQMSPSDADIWGGYDWHLYSKAEFPAIYAVELRNWAAAGKLELVPNAPSFATSLTYWGRSIGAARSGQRDLARANALQVKSIHDAMIASKQAYYEDAVLQEYEEASAWANFADGLTDKAVQALRSIAEKQEAVGNEPTGIPAREMLGDLLLEANQPGRALQEYELDLKFNPNRFNGLYGAGLTAERVGQAGKAREYYIQLSRICAGSKSLRPELAHAREALSKPW
jgi:hypothetical protein